MAHYHTGTNDPGYLPDTDTPAHPFPTWDEAKRSLIDEMLLDAENVASWADPHECDDIPCPTYGDECPEGLAFALTAAAEDLNLTSGPEYGEIVSGRSYWVVPCTESECTDDDSGYGPEDADADADAALRDDHHSGFHSDSPHGGCTLCPDPE